jgi:catechol 2,3-dioxygenase-like lactoylglutathione lyase family enzyme
MYSHITLGTNDFPRAEKFYDAVMAVLGHPAMFKTPIAIAYGTPTGEKPSSCRPSTGGGAARNGVHAVQVDKRATVDAFHAVALANGGTDEGAPGFARTITRTTTARTSAIPTATRSKPSATARKVEPRQRATRCRQWA